MTEERKAEVRKLLTDLLEEKCDDKDDGVYVFDIWPSYDDRISDGELDEILREDHPMISFEDTVSEMYDEYVWVERDYMIDEVVEKAYPSDRGEKEEISDYLLDLCDELTAFRIPYDHYEKQKVRADLMIDTGDSNYDYGCNSVYPYYYGEKGSGIEDCASLVWLAKTQGYTKKQLEAALDDGDVADPKGFLDSVRQEVANETSSMNCLTFLVQMTVKDLIELNELIKLQEPEGEKIWRAELRPDCGTLKIGKNAEVGLYDPWNGAGSVFEIELEKDIVLPIKYIRSCLPDRHFRWSVYSVYGMCGSAWKDVVSDITAPKKEAV